MWILRFWVYLVAVCFGFCASDFEFSVNRVPSGGSMLKGKKIIAIGERDGVPGPVIAECLEGAGYEVVFQVTECFV
jgi:betaine reductase